MYFKQILKINRWYLSLLMLSIISIGTYVINTYKDSPYENISVLLFLFLVITYNYGWLFMAGEYLFPKVSKNTKLSIDKFRKSVIAIIVFYFLMNLYKPFHLEAVDKLLFLSGYVIMVLNIYVVYFVAKSIAVASLGNKYGYENVIKILFLICILPLGILSLHPMISKININD